jgi:hypothetical protein
MRTLSWTAEVTTPPDRGLERAVILGSVNLAGQGEQKERIRVEDRAPGSLERLIYSSGRERRPRRQVTGYYTSHGHF